MVVFGFLHQVVEKDEGRLGITMTVTCVEQILRGHKTSQVEDWLEVEQ